MAVEGYFGVIISIMLKKGEVGTIAVDMEGGFFEFGRDEIEGVY